MKKLDSLSQKEFEEYLESKLSAYSELKRKFELLEITHEQFYEVWDQVKEPDFMKLAKLLKNGKCFLDYYVCLHMIKVISYLRKNM